MTERQEFVGLDDLELLAVPMSFEDWKLELASRAKRWGPMEKAESLAFRARDDEPHSDVVRNDD